MKRILLALVAAAGTASAQPAPQPAPPPGADKVDAKQLMQSGVKLLEAKDYLGALAIFKDAYRRFPSAKILLNIGTTLRLLERNAEAANTYQLYLDAKDTDPARKGEVEQALGELDKTVGTLTLTITPADAEVQFADDWLPAEQTRVWRVPPGPLTVHVRAKGYLPSGDRVDVAAGEKKPLLVALVVEPKPQVPVDVVHVEQPFTPVVEEPRSPIGAFAMMHVAVLPKVGSALFLGGTFDATEQLSLEAAVILGPGLVSDGMATLPPPKLGGYAGARFAFLTGKVRPSVAAGMPIFADDGARFFVRGAAGVEYVASRHLSLSVELGGEVSLNARDDIRSFALVPSLGAIGRL
jgi:hypothetical protein